MRQEGKSNICFFYPRGLSASPILEQGDVFSPCWVFVDNWANGGRLFVLLEVDATLGDGCGIWKHLCSFWDIKCLQGCSKALWIGMHCIKTCQHKSWSSATVETAWPTILGCPSSIQSAKRLHQGESLLGIYIYIYIYIYICMGYYIPSKHLVVLKTF